MRNLQIIGALVLCLSASVMVQCTTSPGQVPVGHDTARYGPVLPIVAGVELKRAMAIDIQGDLAYVIGSGVLTIVDISDAKVPRIIGTLDNLGETRQIQVRDSIAYIASRSAGMFVVDVSDPFRPVRLSHYDSIEFATGIALGGNIAFLPCRLYGVELVDISDPRQPKHISLVRTGVSQSVVYADGFLYVGVWGDQTVVVVDVRNPWDPLITDSLPLDGYGDGVAVYDGHLYAATGQHSRAKPSKMPGDPGFGTGHGLEIFALTDPAHPKPVSRTKFPPEYHTNSHLWTVRVANDHAFIADNYNGLFVLNVSDPAQPAFVGQHQLPYHQAADGPDIVSYLAVTNDYVLITGQFSGMHVVAAPGIAAPLADYTGHPPVIGPRPTERHTDQYRAYYMDGQVYNVVCRGNVGYVAAGQGGLHIVQIWPQFQRTRHIPTDDRVLDVELRDDLLYVAEGAEGLAIWRTEPTGALSFIGRYRVDGTFIRQVIVPEPGRYGLLMIGGSGFHIVDLQDPQQPVCVFKESGQGMLTGDNVADGLIGQRYAGVFWHKSGGWRKETDRIRWYDLHKTDEERFIHETSLDQILTANGIAVMGNQLLVVGHGGYRLVDLLERRDFRSIPLFRLPDLPVIGKPTIHQDHLYISHRAGGEVYLLDIRDIAQPRLIKRFETRGNPSRVVPHDNCLLIPGGYEGLLICELPDRSAGN